MCIAVLTMQQSFCGIFFFKRCRHHSALEVLTSAKHMQRYAERACIFLPSRLSLLGLFFSLMCCLPGLRTMTLPPPVTL